MRLAVLAAATAGGGVGSRRMCSIPDVSVGSGTPCGIRQHCGQITSQYNCIVPHLETHIDVCTRHNKPSGGSNANA